MKIQVFVIIFSLFTVGCSTVNSFFNGKERSTVDSKVPQAADVPVNDETNSITKYSDISNYAPPSDRQYKRMTKERFEDESELQANAGSLWQMEGQTSYLFAENKQRREGDRTAIKVEGSALKQIQMKATTIQDLLNDLEEQKRQAEEKKKKEEAEVLRMAAIEEEKKKIIDKNEAEGDQKIQELAEKRVSERKPASVEAPKPKETAKNDKLDLKDVELIPTKIIEKLPNGYLRVSGQQYLSIKNKPYRVIATGVVKSDDFNDQSISSEKLSDSQFDIVHVKKAETN